MKKQMAETLRSIFKNRFHVDSLSPRGKRKTAFFVSSYTGESLEEYQLAQPDQTATYRMTDKGLMQDDWSKKKTDAGLSAKFRTVFCLSDEPYHKG